MAIRKRNAVIAAALLGLVAVVGGYKLYKKQVPPPQEQVNASLGKPIVTAAPIVPKPPVVTNLPIVEPKLKTKAKRRAAVKRAPKVGIPQTESHAWQRWNAAPFAASFDEACEKAPTAIDGFNMPPAVKEHFKQVLKNGCKGGVEVWLTPHQSLEQMWSGGASPHVMNNVTVGELPVRESSDGRPYRKGSVAETAKALEWSYEYGGQTYYLDLPFVCFNWSWRSGLAMKSGQCVTVTIHPKVGDHIIAVAFTKDYLPASACFKLTQGNRTTSLPAPCTTCDWSGFNGLLSAGNKPFLVTSFIAESENVTLSYPVELKQGDFGLCDTRGGVQSDGHLTKQEQWGAPTAYNVSPEIWPTWDRSQIGRVIK